MNMFGWIAPSFRLSLIPESSVGGASGAWRRAPAKAPPAFALRCRRLRPLVMLREYPSEKPAIVETNVGETARNAFDWLSAAIEAQDGFRALPESPDICRYMNEHCQEHLISYLRNFGPVEQRENLSELERVEMTQVDEHGFELDLIMCSEARNNCVCVHERLSWPQGSQCDTAAKCVARLSEMSQICGLGRLD